jgi:hypothetical protein
MNYLSLHLVSLSQFFLQHKYGPPGHHRWAWAVGKPTQREGPGSKKKTIVAL